MTLASARFPARYDPTHARRKVLAGIVAVLASPVPVLAEPVRRVVAIGDSLTQGYGLPEAEGFVPVLEAWLRDRGFKVEVINMGVSGDTTAGGRARLDWALADGADAVIVALGGNDVLRGIDPSESRANLDAMLGELAARRIPTLLSGMLAPLNYGPEFKTAFDSMYPELAEKHGAYLHPFFLDGVAGEPTLNQSDGIHPNAAGVIEMVIRIGPKVAELLERPG